MLRDGKPNLETTFHHLLAAGWKFIEKDFPGSDIVLLSMEYFLQGCVAMAVAGLIRPDRKTVSTIPFNTECFGMFLYHLHTFQDLGKALGELLSEKLKGAGSKKELWPSMALSMAFIFYIWQIMLDARAGDCIPVRTSRPDTIPVEAKGSCHTAR